MRTRLLIVIPLSLAMTAALLPSVLLAEEKAAHHAHADPAIAAAVAHPDRAEANRARDQYRHPVETLTFFGVKPTDKIVEIWPGGGWYSEILGPLTQGKGQLFLATSTQGLERTKEIATKPAIAHAAVAVFPNADGQMKVPDGVADVVLTFRNVHNWRFGGADSTQEAFKQMFAMLKPGGILGVVDHRLPEDMDSALEEKSGYMKKSSIIGFAKAVGFELVAESDINANPKDSHDWPDGVWTLPPILRKGDTDRERYLAIGESDRLTLKFRKPAL